MKKWNITVRKLVYSAVCLSLALVLPLLTGQIPQIGKMLCPMHLPVLLCGFLCGAPWGAVVGFVTPFLRFAIFAMPPIMPKGIGMAFELAAYGWIAGFLYKILSKRVRSVYISLLAAMIGGRVIWGCVRYILAGFERSEFPFSAFLAGAVTEAIPGIILQIVLVPVLVMALAKAKLTLNE